MGPIRAFMAEDHARLDALLSRALDGRARVELEPFGLFREGLLRHIGIEETILLPALQEFPDAPTKLTDKLRLDHSALANLFMPRPTSELVRAVSYVLDRHNPLEEEPGGFYDACDALLAARAAELIARMERAPKVPLRDYSDRPQALAAAKRALQRAGYSWDVCSGM